VGVVLNGFSQDAYLKALKQAERLVEDPSVRERCRSTARIRFGLDEVGAPRYARIYRRLTEKTQGQR
jgi:hypothetical protein